jgi:hypothetical protein
VNGFTESGSADLDSPHELLGEVKADRPAVREDDLELDSNVKSQLDQLGYI